MRVKIEENSLEGLRKSQLRITRGGVAKWFKAAVSKTAALHKGLVGSNPTSSVRTTLKLRRTFEIVTSVKDRIGLPKLLSEGDHLLRQITKFEFNNSK